MKLLRELRFTGAATTFSETVPIADLRVAGATIQAATASPLNTLTISAAGALVSFQAMACRPYNFGGPAFFFGGPIGGETLNVQTDNNDTYEVIVRLWDEPIRPYGRVPLLCWDEAGIAPAAQSAIFSCGINPGWATHWAFLEVGDEARTVALRQEFVAAVGALATSFTSAANVESQLTVTPVGVSRILRVQATNTGAGNLRTVGSVMGLLGF